MKEEFQTLSEEEQVLLLQAPALVSVLAACSDGKVDEHEINGAKEMTHWKTISSPPALKPYFEKVDRVFDKYLNEVIQTYSPFETADQNRLCRQLERAYQVMEKMDDSFTGPLKLSLNNYANHVANIHRNFLEYLVFPMKIPGITD